MYHHTTPAAQKAMMDVDFTPIFLALLPLFLCVGALLGKSFDSDTARTITTNTTIPDITIYINNTGTTTGTGDTGTGAGADNNTETLILFTNGTYFFPLLSGSIGIGTLGLGSIFGGFFPFFGFGRSLSRSFWDTSWSDMDSLYLLYESLDEITYILDDQERMSCFAEVLCTEQAKSGHDNFFTFFIRYSNLKSLKTDISFAFLKLAGF